jgi:hypothetical protein
MCTDGSICQIDEMKGAANSCSLMQSIIQLSIAGTLRNQTFCLEQLARLFFYNPNLHVATQTLSNTRLAVRLINI